MLTGRVSPVREARITLDVFDADGNMATLDAAIDTGFTDSLMMSETLVQQLGLPAIQGKPYEIGDGSVIELPRYAIDVLWNNARRTVTVVATKAAVPLVGMKLLAGYSITIDVVDGGAVRILRMD